MQTIQVPFLYFALFLGLKSTVGASVVKIGPLAIDIENMIKGRWPRVLIFKKSCLFDCMFYVRHQTL